jgi:hypothetical protein
MNDTSPRAEALVLELLRKKTPEQRAAMAAEMFDAARASMESALRAEGLVPNSPGWKLALLDRTYGAEVSARLRAQLVARWSE